MVCPSASQIYPVDTMRKLCFLTALALLTGCASDPDNLGWVTRPRKGEVLQLVMHYTAAGNESSLKILSGKDPTARVSVHYLITDEPEPRIIPIVPEDTVAFHAGVSHWRGLNDLNETSIGIEVVNLNGNLHPYSEAQFAAIASLASDIVRRHKILPQNVVAHSDIAPSRKLDPGILFPWRRLEREAGVGCYPSPSDVAEKLRSPSLPALTTLDIQRALSRWGYQVPMTGKLDDTTRHALSAFQRHYRPSKVDGQPDRETVATLLVLLEQTGL